MFLAGLAHRGDVVNVNAQFHHLTLKPFDIQPGDHGQGQSDQFEHEFGGDPALHFFPFLGGYINSLRRSQKCSWLLTAMNRPSKATATSPVSSEAKTTTASLCSVSPKAARWRVPTVLWTEGLLDKGNRQAHAAIRSPHTTTPPSWAGEDVMKKPCSNGADILQSRMTP